MGKAAKKIKKQMQKAQHGLGRVIVEDTETKEQHHFNAKQMAVIADMVSKAREEGRQKAALEFVKWIGTINEIRGIGAKRARDIADHFLAYGPGGSKQ